MTVRAIDALKPAGRRLEYFDAHTPGLALRLTEQGRRTWVLLYRNKDRRLRRLTLGTYPDLSLAKARKQAQSARGKIADGQDPATEKRDAVRAATRKGD